MSACDANNPFQRFNTWWSGPGTRLALVHVKSNKCVTGLDGDKVALLSCPGANDLRQRWDPESGDRLKNAVVGRCLDANQTTVYTLPCGPSTHQKWNVLDV